MLFFARGACPIFTRCQGYALVSNASSSSTRSPFEQSHFYKTFTRPIAKVLLLAVFTYQVVYWTWAKLEADEIRANTDGLSCPPYPTACLHSPFDSAS